MNANEPKELDEQINAMKYYVNFSNKTKMKTFLSYTGYFRALQYGKFLLSMSNELKGKQNQEFLFELYEFDVKLRQLFYKYTKKAEVQFKTYLSNSIALKTNDELFYLNDAIYTPSKSESDKLKKNKNKSYFDKFFKNLKSSEKDIRTNVKKYPDLKDYRSNGAKSKYKIPCWVAFYYFEFGNIVLIYEYLRGDLRKEVLKYGYSNKKYGKETTKQLDTWLNSIRTLRNICSHHNRLIGKTSSVVLPEFHEQELLNSKTDLFSRLYALNKVLNPKDSQKLSKELSKIIQKNKNIDIYKLKILPENWEELYRSISSL